jgi:hypothetical protein
MGIARKKVLISLPGMITIARMERGRGHLEKTHAARTLYQVLGKMKKMFLGVEECREPDTDLCYPEIIMSR